MNSALAAPLPPVSPQRNGQVSRRLVLVAIDKGGVGKSFFCIQLISWLRGHGIPYTAYDPDHANSTLSRFIHDAIFLSSRHSENLDVLVEKLEETPVVVLDGMVGRQGLVFDWIDETNLLRIAEEEGFHVTLALVIEDDKDAVHQAGEAVKRFQNRVDWLVVKNHKMNSTFRIYQASNARTALLEAGAREISLPKLAGHLNEELQRRSVTIPEALDEGHLYLLDRQRLLDYQRQIFTLLDGVKEVLI